MNKTIKEVLYISLLSVFSALLYNAFFSENYPLIYQKTSFKPGQVVSTTDAYRLLRSGEVIFIDARPQEDYTEGHIQSALNLPVRSSRVQKMTMMQKIPKEQNIVVYCIDSGCPSAERLAKELEFMGFKNVTVYADGWLGWQNAGYPIEKGEENE